MIKKLIFDIDNTLIEWKNEYNFITVKESLKKLNLNYNEDLINKVNLAIANYESKHDYFNKETLLNDINLENNSDFGIEFINEFLNMCITLAVPKKLPKAEIITLDYLSSKYELVALTNWFEYSQIERLKKLDIYKYFSKVIGTESIKVKPNKEAFLAAIGNNKIEECCMIGDSLNVDIKGALNISLKAIYLNSNKVDLPNCTCINNFKDLRNIF